MPRPGVPSFHRFTAVHAAAVCGAVGCMLSWSVGQAAKPAPVRTVSASAIFHDYCAACHGLEGKGNGPAAPALKTKVPDLTRIAKDSKGMFPRERVRKIIEGADSMTSHGSREMPVWGPVFHEIGADQDLGNVRVDNLIRYLESLQQK